MPARHFVESFCDQLKNLILLYKMVKDLANPLPFNRDLLEKN